MTGHAMTWALAARMTIWTILILGGMFGIAVVFGRRLRSVGYDYPEPTEPEQDYEEGTAPPHRAA